MMFLRHLRIVTEGVQLMFSNRMCARCLSSRNRKSHQQKRSARKPVSFNLASRIHASMLASLKKYGTLEIDKKSNFDEKVSINWEHEFQDLSKTLEKSQPHVNMLRTIEGSFKRKIHEVSLQQSLQVADLFFLNKYRQWIFLTGLFDYVTQKPLSSFPASQLTHLMFYVFFLGQAPPELYQQMDEHLSKNLKEFHVNDIGIICLGYFRGHNRIKSFQLLDRISDRVLQDFHELQEDMLINILKTFRHSGFAKVSFFEPLSERLLESSFIKNSNSLNNLMHIAMTYACTAVCCKNLNQELLERFTILVKKSSRPRSKDIGKFVWAMGTFVHEPIKERSSYLALVEAFSAANRSQEKEHPESLSDILQGLTYLGIHQHHLTERIFQPEVAHALRDSAVYGKLFQLQLLQNTILIECPDYKGRLLSSEFMRELQQLPGMTCDLDFEMKTRQGLNQIFSCLQTLLGHDRVHAHFILPHFTLADIELRLDDNRQAVPFKAVSFADFSEADEEGQNTTSGPCSSTNKVAVEILGYNQCFINTLQLTGNVQTKLRQLKKLGYTVVLFMPAEATKLADMKEEERRQYLIEKLHQEVGLMLPA